MSEHPFSLHGKVALVTGASGGLGEHFARVLAANGASVALCARRVDQLERVSNELGDAGATALPMALDVCDAKSVAAAMATIEGELGTPDILINNAGVAQTQRFLEITEDAWQRIIDVRIIGFAVHGGALDGPAVCRLFNRIVAGQEPPRNLSSEREACPRGTMIRFSDITNGKRTFEFSILPKSKRCHMYQYLTRSSSD